MLKGKNLLHTDSDTIIQVELFQSKTGRETSKLNYTIDHLELSGIHPTDSKYTLRTRIEYSKTDHNANLSKYKKLKYKEKKESFLLYYDTTVE